MSGSLPGSLLHNITSSAFDEFGKLKGKYKITESEPITRADGSESTLHITYHVLITATRTMEVHD